MPVTVSERVKWFTLVKKVSFLLPLILMPVLFQCSDDSDEVGFDQLSEYARKFLLLRSSQGLQTAAGSASAINHIFASLRMIGYYEGDPGSDADSYVIDDPWVSCAEVTEFDHPDGSSTIIRDYAGGCEEDGFTYFLFGKITETYLFNTRMLGTSYRSDYLYNVAYENFGSRHEVDTIWMMNGNGRYEGWGEYDTVSSKFEGEFSYADDIIYCFADAEFEYASSGRTRYSDKQWEQVAGGYSRFAEGDNFYRSDILRTLVVRYNCMGGENQLWLFPIPVAGLENITYRYGGKTGEFLIDYGNGSCDDEVVIIENGKRVRIRMMQAITALINN